MLQSVARFLSSEVERHSSFDGEASEKQEVEVLPSSIVLCSSMSAASSSQAPVLQPTVKRIPKPKAGVANLQKLIDECEHQEHMVNRYAKQIQKVHFQCCRLEQKQIICFLL